MTSIRWCPVESGAEVQAFLETNWSRGHVLAHDEELFSWQHRFPGDPGLLSVLLAENGGDLIGILGVIQAPSCHSGREGRGAWLTTWVVAPEHRSGGAGLKLVQELLDGGFALIGTLGGNRITQQILAALGFETVDALPRWTRSVSEEALTSLLGATGRNYGQDSLETWKRTADARPAQPGPVDEWDRSSSAERWDLAWRTVHAPEISGTWRDSAYLRWRYLDHPRFQYDVLRAGETGLAVMRTERVRDREECVVRVLELLAKEARVADALLAEVLRRASAQDAAFVDFYCSSERIGTAFERAGFVRDDLLEEGLPALLQPLDASRSGLTAALRPGDVLSGPNSYLTRSDCDQDRPN